MGHLQVSCRIRGKLCELRQQIGRLRRAQARGRPQIAHQPAARHLRQGQCRGRQYRVVGELAIEIVVGQQQAPGQVGGAAGAGGSAHTGEAAAESLGVAATQTDVCRRAADVDALYTQLRKREQLAALADAILVQVFPQLDAGERDIAGIEFTVGNPAGVGIQIGKGGKAVGSQLTGIGAAGQDGVVA